MLKFINYKNKTKIYHKASLKYQVQAFKFVHLIHDIFNKDSSVKF